VNNSELFSKRLLNWRARCNYTQTQAAALLGVGRSYYSQLENGREAGPLLLAKFEREVNLSEHEGTSRVNEGAETPRSRLKAAREQANMSVAELSKATGYAIGVLQALEDGGARISEKCADKLASVLPISTEDLLGGGESLRVFSEDGTQGIVGQKPNLKLMNVKARYVPLLSFAQAGRADVAALDEGYTGEAFIAFDVPDAKAFALRIEGDSMTPFINQGDVVILSPGSALRRGDEVVVQTIEGECFCKVWGGIVGGMVTLSSHNPQHPPFTLPQSHIAWVYPVIQTSKTRR
jgi:phage repressor protein C with HTH and peptisase S24 domain